MILDEHRLVFVHVTKTGGTSIEKHFGQRPSDHRTCRDYIGLLGRQTFADYFSFTIVRNPWDKMVSQYFFNAHKWTPEGTSFSQYIRMFGAGEKLTTYPPLHFPYFMDDNGEPLVDYIGRFEALQESFDHVCNRIGIAATELPHHKKSRHEHYREYYDDESRGIVADAFADEIAYFQYQF